MLTRREMEKVIDDGGSVLVGDKVIKKKAFLPNEAQLAIGDAKLEAQAKANLEADIAEKKAQLEFLAAEEAKVTELKAEEDEQAEETVETTKAAKNPVGSKRKAKKATDK